MTNSRGTIPLRCAALLLAAGCAPPSLRPDTAGEADARIEDARRAERAGQDIQALSHYRQALLMDPQRIDAHLGRARLFEKRGNLPEAETAYAMAVEAAAAGDDWVRAFRERGGYRLRRNRPESAIQDFTRAIDALSSADSRRFEILLLRARARAQLARWDPAEDDLKPVLERATGAIREEASELLAHIRAQRASEGR